MLTHGREEMEALAERCELEDVSSSQGWVVDLWRMQPDDVDAAIEVYRALLLGSATDPVIALLARANIDLPQLLLDEEDSRDEITRSDLTELTAAASMIAYDGCDAARMHMPNVPKMSRRKSDSGVDVFDIALSADAAPGDDLTDDDYLTIASVKHTVQNTAAGLRWALIESLSSTALSQAYLAAQLRVLDGGLQQEGVTLEAAGRVYLFLREFPDGDRVSLIAIGVVDPTLETSLRHQVTLLPDSTTSNRTFRMILFPGVSTVHSRCP